jgi:uncharacterized protein (TIGR02001 family)
MIRKSVIAGAMAAAWGSGVAHAQTTPAAPPHAVTGNVGLFSQYIFRGLTQTNKEPALQGGLDYAHDNGFYAGTWGSNVSWLRDGGAYASGGSLELDFYAGHKGTIVGDFTYDVGGLYYWYPGDPAPGLPKADTFELYGALGWKWITVKYSHSMSNKTFGVTDSRGTYYLDVTAAVPVGNTGLTAIAHWGKQKYDGHAAGSAFDNDALYSHEDWKIGVSYALPQGYTVGAYYTDTSGANPLGYGSVAQGGPYPRNVAKGTGTVFLQKSF